MSTIRAPDRTAMSDLMFMLESRLSADQNRVLEHVQAAAGTAGVNLFLTGGGMRDLLGGFQIRDLDFSVEGNALKLAKALEEQGARILAIDENRRSAELGFPGGVSAQVAMSRKERYARTGARPQVTPTTIQEDLRGRDFTVNAIALSLNRASRGLLLDPTNGLADLARREIRSTHPHAFYDDPARLLRLVRLRVRLSFTVEERTRMQFENACAAQVQNLLPPRALLEELRHIAAEPSPAEVMQALDRGGLAALFSPAFTVSGMNLQALARLEKASKLVESAQVPAAPPLAPFLLALTAKLTSKEKSGLFKTLELPKAEIDQMRLLEPRSRKLEQTLKSARISKPSHVYQTLADAPTDEIVFLLGNSALRVVHERIRSYLQKYLPAAREIPQAAWAALEGQPGTPKYNRNRQALLAAHLDVRPRKPSVPEPEPVAAAPSVARGRMR
jgi:tRNA nucleotidyltransferase (CCA-adding enzyme)